MILKLGVLFRNLRCAFTKHEWHRERQYIICSRCYESIVLVSEDTQYQRSPLEQPCARLRSISRRTAENVVRYDRLCYFPLKDALESQETYAERAMRQRLFNKSQGGE